MEARRLVLGILIILVGSYLLLDNFGLIPRGLYFLRSWQMLLILIGVFNYFSGKKRAAYILFAIGGFFLVEDYLIYDFRDLWPILLIVVGVVFLLGRGSRTSRPENDENFFDDINIFGGGDQKFVSPQLEGGRIMNIFGGSTVDLRDSIPTQDVTIEVFTLFGGCEIIAPDDWKIKIDAFSLFGGFSDGRRSANITEESPQIRIKGFTMFGGGEIKSR